MDCSWVHSPRARRIGCTDRPASMVQAASPPMLSCSVITKVAPTVATATMVRFEKNAPRPWAMLLRKVTR